MTDNDITVKHVGLRDYESVWHDMQQFTEARTPDTTDEIWLVEHPSVFTLGLNGKNEHILDPDDIPVVNCDRGGQVTYHGPGQLIAYLLLDLRRRDLGVKALVNKIEQAIIDLLAESNIEGQRLEGAPGIYVDGKKIAALGLRIRRGCCYHGLSLNVDMDLSPFSRINPCGFEGLSSDQLAHHLPNPNLQTVTTSLLAHLRQQLIM